MKRTPETVRAYLMRTTALSSGVIQAPKPPVENHTFTVLSKGKRGKRIQKLTLAA